jgi:hypothetical protein
MRKSIEGHFRDLKRRMGSRPFFEELRNGAFLKPPALVRRSGEDGYVYRVPFASKP